VNITCRDRQDQRQRQDQLRAPDQLQGRADPRHGPGPASASTSEKNRNKPTKQKQATTSQPPVKAAQLRSAANDKEGRERP